MNFSFKTQANGDSVVLGDVLVWVDSISCTGLSATVLSEPGPANPAFPLLLLCLDASSPVSHRVFLHSRLFSRETFLGWLYSSSLQAPLPFVLFPTQSVTPLCVLSWTQESCVAAFRGWCCRQSCHHASVRDVSTTRRMSQLLGKERKSSRCFSTVSNLVLYSRVVIVLEPPAE